QLINHNGQLLSQPIQGPIAFLNDIPQGELGHALQGHSPLRRLLPTGSGLGQRAVLAFTGDEEKSHCRLHMVFLAAGPERAAAVATLQGIKGYDESLLSVQQQLQELGGCPFNGQELLNLLFPPASSYNAKPDIPLAA